MSQNKFSHGWYLQGQWLALYHCHCNQQVILKKNEIPLLEFITSIVNSWHLAQKIRSYERPKKCSLSPTPIVPKPIPDVRYDSVDHFQEFNEIRDRCHFCPDGYSYLVQKYCIPYYSNFYSRHILEKGQAFFFSLMSLTKKYWLRTCFLTLCSLLFKILFYSRL